jgi:hypothetical protein
MDQEQLPQFRRHMSRNSGESVEWIFNEHEELTLPFAAKSSPRLIVVPTAIYSLLPVSVLDVSSVTHDMALINSFVANSKLYLASAR